MTSTSPQYRIEPEGQSGGHCDCCGTQSSRVWGFVYQDGAAVACYYLSWTVGQSLEDHPANFDLIFGKWGEGCTAQDRVAISMVHFANDNGPAVSLIDATTRPTVAQSGLANTALRRDEVIGTPLAAIAFAIFDAVILQDSRLR